MHESSSESAKITDIQPGRRRGRFNIYIEGEFAVAVGEKVLVELGLKIGNSFDPDGIRILANSAERDRAMNTALRYLEMRPRSKREIEQRLARNGFEDEIKTQVIEKLQELKLIDDADFAQRWIENRNRTRPKSIRSLKSELAQKGITKDEIEEAVTLISPEDEIALARAAIVKNLGSKRQVPTDKVELEQFNKRLIGFLQRRGFNWSTIKAAMSLQLDDIGDED